MSDKKAWIFIGKYSQLKRKTKQHMFCYINYYGILSLKFTNKKYTLKGKDTPNIEGIVHGQFLQQTMGIQNTLKLPSNTILFFVGVITNLIVATPYLCVCYMKCH